jgi:hypothetical protein
VLVLLLRPVAALAKELASPDRLSGRLIVAAAAGWLEAVGTPGRSPRSRLGEQPPAAFVN